MPLWGDLLKSDDIEALWAYVMAANRGSRSGRSGDGALFELPVLFYALVLYRFVTNQVDAVYVYAAWIFAAFRALHSAVHCTFNRIMLRFYLYLISTLALWFMAIRAALA